MTDAPPVASLSTNPSAIKPGQSLTANASGSSDTDGTPIASYTFNFGNGSAAVGPQTSPTATHVYTKTGDFTVTVTVKDTAGNASTATKKIKVH